MTDKTLTIPTEGPCAGHPCDNCKICQSGRCCRNDNPDYKLPQLGEWDGPIYGELGVLEDDGQKVECHCCGEWFVRLGCHTLTHDLTAEEYKSIFGLNRHRGLASTANTRSVSESRKADKKNCERMSRMAREHSEKRTPEQQSQYGSRPKRLEWRVNVSKNRVTRIGSFTTPGNRVLTESHVKSILAITPRPTRKVEQMELAHQYGVHLVTIQNIFAGRTWKHLWVPTDITTYQLSPKNGARLTIDDVRRIREMNPHSNKDVIRVSKMFEICVANVRKIVSRSTWAWLDAEEVAA